ncbi:MULTISPECIES: LysR family transcriptional regulator [unclassified Achromobacter]|uniref:LysR family transcriptional regulator n=1 Tax=unclassified Achromobacter TaxID=2626865 RepID=UPI000B51ACD7|nr:MULTISPECIES: LysR family transcriptional regulator [unclassified Achromobacter]OWT80070.1 LysR family transcriptional regulator [Achromobacter sp. HZ34]OWT81953.1 LysR family transcriptional regulator [Achromobacter sp. HZ28]
MARPLPDSIATDTPTGPPITPELLVMLDAIARTGSFARAARELDKVPSAITYAVRRLEDKLDVLLFDRSGHRAVLTLAGTALLEDGRVVLQSLEDLARRVRRIATGWELELRIAVGAIVAWRPIYDLIEEFQALGSDTKLRFSSEVLSGSWDALTSGRADLVIGADASTAPPGRYESRPLGEARFAFCVAPHHPLATVEHPLTPTEIAAHCAVVVADTARALPPATRNLLDQQQRIVMPTMQGKIDAQIRGLGCGYVPRALAGVYLAQGLLVEKATQEQKFGSERLLYAWRAPVQGEALKWWLKKLESERLCVSLTEGMPALA